MDRAPSRAARLRARVFGAGMLASMLRLTTGTVLGQGLLLAVAPLLTRVYEPTDFAMAAVFAAASTLLAVVATARFEFALMLPEEECEAAAILVVGMLVPVLVSLALGGVCWTAGPALLAGFGLPDLEGWLHWLPWGVLLLGWWSVGSKWEARQQRFTRLARSELTYGAGTAGAQLVPLLFVSASGTWLIIGQLVGRALASVIVLHGPLADAWRHRAALHGGALRNAWRAHWRFPVYSVPASLISQAAHQLPSFMLPVFGADVLGYFALCNRALNAPMALLGSSIAHVFYPSIARARREGRARALLVRSYGWLIAVVLPPLVVLFIWAEDLFAWIFDEPWRPAGAYARLIIPMVLVKAMVSPTALSMQAFGRQLPVLLWMIAYLLLGLGVFHLGAAWGDASLTILNFSLVTAGMYLVYMWMSVRASD